MAQTLTFRKATKTDAKLRLALCGPAGSGKTFSSLSIATELGGPIAYVDTEHGSASKYADLFAFDVIEPDEFDPRKLIETIKAAIEAGYKVICIDSLSHYWMGKGGELDLVDASAKKAQGNSFAAWKNVTPIHNELVDTIISAPIHIIVSMRTKTEWVIEENDRGKKVPRKIGLAPVMRDGIEFEFDVCGDMDQDNKLTVTKSRCPELAGKVIDRPGKEMARTLKAWCTGATVAELFPAKPVPPPTPFKASGDDIPTNLGGTHEPQPGNSADGRIDQARARQTAPAAEKPWTTFKGMLERFADLKEKLGDDSYYAILKAHGVEHANAFKSGDKALACFSEMWAANIKDAA